MIALLAAVVLAQPVELARPEGPIVSNPAAMGAFAFFEFAPSNGRGMGAPCACAAITGAKGEAVTITRGSTATCSKQGLATTGIANGDLVDCASNLPRVESSGGVYGLRVEGTRTNDAVRNIELDNASWLLASGGAPNPGAPTRTANAGVAPNGLTQAEQVDFASTTGTGFGVIYQGPFLSTVATYTTSVYVRGVSGAGTIYLMSTDGTTYRTSACAFVSTSWSRCVVTGAETAVNWYLQIGFDLRDGAQTGQGAQSVYLWRPQRELGAFASSPMETVAVAVTRSDEGAYATASLQDGAGCMAGSLETAAPTLTNGRIVSAFVDVNNRFENYIDATSPSVSVVVAGSSETSFTTAASMPGGPFRVITTRVPSSTRSVQLVGNAPTSAASALAAFGANLIYLGRYGQTNTNQPNGIITRVQVDPSSTRCTP